MTRLANSKNCFVCGVENENGLKLVLESKKEGHVSGKFSVSRKFEGWPGIVHGGILAAIMDEAAGRTTETEPIPKQTFFTGTLTTHYRHPVHCDIPLLVEAEVVSRRGRVVTTKSRIMDESRQVLAESEIVYVQILIPIEFDHTSSSDEWVVLPGEEK